MGGPAAGSNERDTPVAVCFDATGTLIETAEAVGQTYRRFALEYGVDLPAWRLEDAFARVMRVAPPRGLEGASPAARRRAELDWWFERIRQTFQATDSTARFEDFQAFAGALFDHFRRGDAWRVRAEVRSTLGELSRRGARMAVASNFDHRLPEILEALELNDLFESVEIPSKHGLAKPDPGVFERLAERLESAVVELHYVGDDSPETLEAIAAQGVRVIDLDALDRFSDLLDRLGAR